MVETQRSHAPAANRRPPVPEALTAAELEQRVGGADALLELVPGLDAAAVRLRVETAIAVGEGLVLSAVRARDASAVLSPAVPEVVKDCIAVLARHRLLELRDAPTDDDVARVRVKRQWLDKVARGEAVVRLSPAPTASSGAVSRVGPSRGALGLGQVGIV